MLLVLDVGNTRLKWAQVDESELAEQQAVVHRNVKSELWGAAVFKSTASPSRILASNVAGLTMARTLARMAKRTYGLPIEFISTTADFQGLHNSYLNPLLLGVDRWLALIGAWTRTRSALCIVDVGTAVKVDAVNAHGQHLGGLIVPGIRMMRAALMSETSNIALAAKQSTPSLTEILANNTLDAISLGTVFALAGMADRAAELVERRIGEKPKLYITGGDADLIASNMHTRGEAVSDLVLQGLAVVASSNHSA